MPVGLRKGMERGLSMTVSCGAGRSIGMSPTGGGGVVSALW
jgi:hypothetical protein